MFRLNQQQHAGGQLSTHILDVETSTTMANKHKTCYLCDSRNLQTARNLFANKVQTATTSAEPLAAILSDILQRPIDEETVHSTVVCKNCYYSCNEYELLSKRLHEIRSDIIDAYSKTVAKYSAHGIDIESNEMRLIYETNPDPIGDTFETMEDDGSYELTAEQMGKVFSNDSMGKSNSIVLIKSETTPIFSMSNIENMVQSGDDSQESAYQTVILEEINDTEFVEPEPNEHYMLSDKEYLDANDDLMIDVIHDESNDLQTLDDETNANASSGTDDTQSKHSKEHGDHFEIRVNNDSRDELTIINGYSIKPMVQSNRTTRSGGARQSAQSSSSKKLFIRDGMKFKCALCDTSANAVIYDTKTIAIHLKTDHNERVYVCSICGLDFRKRTPFNEHMDEHISGTKDGVYECEYCQTAYTDVRLFRAHKKTHSSNMKIWTCKDCNKNYSSKNLLDEHMNMHTGDRPYKCPHCVKDFASKYTLTAHMKIHYDRKRPYECTECGKSFFSNQNLMQHERTHTGIKEYECDVCHKKFGTHHNLDVHKIVHTGYKPFVCRTCGKGFARRAEIKDHERTHTGERPYKCDLCKASFAQRSNLMSHKRATHFNDKRYKCDTCDRSFKRRRLLEYHIKATHTGERPYKCDVCYSTFVYPEHFKKHVRIHSGIKPFLCEVCGKAFNSRDNRNAHRYVHSDKKPYECMVCGVGYMRKPLLYAHMETANHLNDTIIINQPHISSKEGKEIVLSDTEEGSINDTDIVYLNLNEDELEELGEDEYGFDEKNIIEEEEEEDDEEEEKSHEENLIEDGHVQFSAGKNARGKKVKNTQKRNQIFIQNKLVSDGEVDDDADISNPNQIDDQTDDAHEILQSNSVDPLQLVQICVPGESDNVSWVSLVPS